MPEAALPIAAEQETVAARGVYTDAERELLRQLQLPEEDETPLESHYHALQQQLLAEVIHQHFKGRNDYFCGTNMFVYYSLEQAQGISDFVEGKRESAPYKGPDLLVVVGVDGTKRRKHWVVWDEDDRFPDLIVEITSPSTKSKDTDENLKLFAQVFRTREYFWYDEEAGEWMGYRLQGESYVPIEVNERGWRWSEVLGAWLGVSELPYRGWRYRWLRLYDVGGRLVPTGEELAAAERERAEAERQRAEQAERRIERERQRAEAERQRAEQERQRAEAERQRAEQERLLREQERQRAEAERQRAEQERQRAEQAERRLAELEAELKRLRSDG
jgi:Uma2 family endonuclease